MIRLGTVCIPISLALRRHPVQTLTSFSAFKISPINLKSSESSPVLGHDDPVLVHCVLEMSMGIKTIGIPWDSHGNGNQSGYITGMGIGMGI